ncbi:MAG: preprotein translocase subunit SecE [Clostridia bacterium]|jgi:preprotein translocase subunit SecE|nr:preprotein translocase subunit SecE [Clostridia bacterium]
MAKKEKDVNKKQKGHFFKDMKAELKKVIWPTPKQTANNTLAVIGFTLAIAIVVFVLDICFDAINKNGVVALQEKIKSSYSVSNTTENTSDAENSVEEANNVENSTANSTEVEVETNTTNTESQE